MCSSNSLPTPVHRQVIDDLVEPGFRISARVQFAYRENERILHHVTRVLERKPMFPDRPAD
jgi:hypothetical protein